MSGIIKRSTVTAVTDYHDYRGILRWDFWFSCAYCNISECEAGGVRFTIDHYEPQSQRPELICVYANLMYCCDTCNTFKGDKPGPALARLGFRILNPDLDDPNEHFELQSHRLLPKTDAVGKYTIAALNLNRQTLRRLREIRERLFGASKAITDGARALEGIRIQDLPVQVRARFLELKAKHVKLVEQAGDQVNRELAREFNRSFLVDDDVPDGDTDDRRTYLKGLRVMVAALGDDTLSGKSN